MNMTTMLMIASSPMKISAKFHASVSVDCAPKNTARAHTMRNTYNAGRLVVMNLKFCSA